MNEEILYDEICWECQGRGSIPRWEAVSLSNGKQLRHFPSVCPVCDGQQRIRVAKSVQA